jgi:rod shape-determining protein MreD
MWYKYVLIVAIFYLLEILQNSFFAHFNLWGAVPNLVFIFFILLVFFSVQGRPSFGLEIIFYGLSAGFFLDIFSSAFIGVSIILLIVIGLLIKRFQMLLVENRGQFSFFQFLLVFVIAFLVYNFLLGFYFYFTQLGTTFWRLDLKLAGEIVYNLIFAAIFFFTYKKLTEGRLDNRQLSLFRKK